MTLQHRKTLRHATTVFLFRRPPTESDIWSTRKELPALYKISRLSCVLDDSGLLVFRSAGGSVLPDVSKNSNVFIVKGQIVQEEWTSFCLDPLTLDFVSTTGLRNVGNQQPSNTASRPEHLNARNPTFQYCVHNKLLKLTLHQLNPVQSLTLYMSHLFYAPF
jgi:hypothetical protein